MSSLGPGGPVLQVLAVLMLFGRSSCSAEPAKRLKPAGRWSTRTRTRTTAPEPLQFCISGPCMKLLATVLLLLLFTYYLTEFYHPFAYFELLATVWAIFSAVLPLLTFV